MVDGPVPQHRFTRTGRVVDATGAPVPHAFVVVVAGTVAMPEIALESDDSGRFTIRLPAGHFTLRAHADAEVGEAEVDGAGDTEVVVVVGSAG
jgi:hypothetical protein